MLIFIDESGCTGFKLNKGSSSHFVIAMVIFNDHKQAELTSQAIQELQLKLHVKTEFKFSKTHQSIKDNFFHVIKDFDFYVQALVVRKSSIHSQYLRINTKSFYNFFIAQLMKHDGGLIKNASVKLDGSGDQTFKREIRNYLKKQLPSGMISKLTLVDSKKNSLIQLADMVAGSIARSYHPEKPNSKWLNALRKFNKINDIWDFK